MEDRGVHRGSPTMKCIRLLSSNAAIVAGIALLSQLPQSALAQAITRSVSTSNGQTLTLTHDQSGRTASWTRPDGKEYTRETDRYRGGKSTVLYGPAGGLIERESSRANRTRSVTLTGPSGQSGSRIITLDEQGQAIRTLMGPAGNSVTKTLGYGKAAQ